MNTVLTVQGSSVAVENKKSVLSRIFNKTAASAGDEKANKQDLNNNKQTLQEFHCVEAP